MADRPTSQRSSRPPRAVPTNRPSSSGKQEASRRKQTLAGSLAAPSEMMARTVSSVADVDDDPEALRRRFRDIDDRRYREWNNFQIAQRTPDEHGQPPNYVFFDLSIAEAAPMRVVIELFHDTPITGDNFRTLLLGERGFAPNGIKLDYIDSACWRVIPEVGMYLGELAPGVSMSADGSTFADEHFAHRHTARGTVSMASRGPHTNGSGFFISFGKTPQFDFQQVVFGRVVEGMQSLDAVEALPTTRNGTPKVPVVISFCGALSGKAPQRSLPDTVADEPPSPKTSAPESTIQSPSGLAAH